VLAPLLRPVTTMLGLDVRTVRVLWTIGVFAGAGALVFLLRRVLLLLVFALVFAYLIFPLVQLAQRWRVLRRHRILAIAVAYLAVLAGLTLVGFSVGPRLRATEPALAQELPEMSEQVQTGEIVGRILRRWGWDPARVRQAEALVRDNAEALIARVEKAGATVLAKLTGAWVVVLVPIFAFFFLKDGDRFTETVERLIASERWRRLWREAIRDIHELLGQYVRALIILCCITFVVWTAVFLIADVPYAVPLAVFGGALEFIPVVGPAVAGLVVMLASLFAGYSHPILLLSFLVGWRLIQDYVTSPFVMARGVELHPALVIFGVLAGGEIAGVPGMFLSVPVMAAVRVIWRRLHAPRAGPVAVARRETSERTTS